MAMSIRVPFGDEIHVIAPRTGNHELRASPWCTAPAMVAYGASTTTWKYANIFRRPRESGDPVAFVKKTLDSRFRGTDGERISMFRNLRVEKLVY